MRLKEREREVWQAIAFRSSQQSDLTVQGPPTLPQILILLKDGNLQQTGSSPTRLWQRRKGVSPARDSSDPYDGLPSSSPPCDAASFEEESMKCGVPD